MPVTQNSSLAGTNVGHGIGFSPSAFTHLLPLRLAPAHDQTTLAALAVQMQAVPDALSDGADPEENLYLPAGYTYLGQFIDHDLTLDTTSTLALSDLADPNRPANDPSNRRTPRFDLDCVYGNGPEDQPYMYVQSDAGSRSGRLFKDASLVLRGNDLDRGTNGRALIGDKRNDENSIVNQIQQAFLKFHNAVVRQLVDDGVAERGVALFRRARDEVRWAYQQVLVDDFLPRLVGHTTLNAFKAVRVGPSDLPAGYKLFTPDKRANLPREFVVAAYRYGHSMVRTGYRLNGNPEWFSGQGTRLSIFNDMEDPETSLIGFDALPPSHLIDDWGRFFPVDHPQPGSRGLVNADATAEAPAFDLRLRLQYAYKIDPSLVDPLSRLPGKIAAPEDVPGVRRGGERPSLALLNLLRGNRYLIQSGQSFEKIVGSHLPPEDMMVRVRRGEEEYSFEPVSDAIKRETPLWFYVLAEAQQPMIQMWRQRGEANLHKDDLLGRRLDPRPGHEDFPLQRGLGGQLGPVGGLIVTEVFYGLLDSDAESVMHRPLGWHPIWGQGVSTFARLLQFAGLKVTEA